MNLNYNLPLDQRIELTRELTSSDEPISRYDLSRMADYIIDAIPKNKEILTDNRLVTINKRETSYQGIAEKLEGGEDSIYGMRSTLGKSELLTPQIEITENDLKEIPGMRELKDAIQDTERQCDLASGRKRFLLKKQLIEMRQQQYILKESYRKPSRGQNPIRAGLGLCKLNLDENVKMVNEEPVSDGLVTLFKEEHVKALLKDYVKLKRECYGKFDSDLWFLMLELDSLLEELKEQEPFLWDIWNWKVEGWSNQEIREMLMDKWGKTHSVEYISSLWKKKIPKWLVEKEKERYIYWYYTEVERGKWKRCSRCGQLKLAHNRWFSKNKTSKDGYYSICKKCRNSKKEAKKSNENC